MPEPARDRRPHARPAPGRPREPRAPVGDAGAGAGRQAERDRPRRGRGPRGRLADPRPAAGHRRRRARAPPLGAPATGRRLACRAARREARRDADRRRARRPPRGGRRRPPSASSGRASPPGTRRPRRRPDRGRRPAGHPAGRHGPDRRHAASRSSPRRARRSSTARRSRSSRPSPRRSPRRTGPTAPAPAGRPDRGRPGPHREPGRDRPARSSAPAARSASRRSSRTPRRTASRSPRCSPTRRSASARPTRSARTSPRRRSSRRRSITGCDAVHPGYGFLSEDDAFADAVRAHDLTFIGPPSHVLERFASKEETRRLLAAHGLPTIPGSGLLLDEAQALEEAERVGYPVLVKPSAGGGGKGMRMVRSPRELAAVLPICRSEARAAFGDDSLYLEKLARGQPPRRDPGRGRPVRPRRPPLGARLQRPAPPPEDPRGEPVAGDVRRGPPRARRARDQGGRRGRLRERRHARVPRRQRRQRLLHRDQLPDPGGAPGHRDAHRASTSSRLQIRIALGEPLGFTQADVPQRGHAIEFRINAEDPEHDFRPGAGTIERFNAPGGPGVRFDSHAYAGLRGPAVLRQRCWASSSCGARPARRRSPAAGPPWPSSSSRASSPTSRSTARCSPRSRSSRAGSPRTCSTASAAPRSSPRRPAS